MEIKIAIKQLGKKHPLLKEQPFYVPCSPNTISLDELLRCLVQQQVEAYNSRQVDVEDKDTTHSPLNDYLSQLMETGKVGFGNRYNANKQDLEKAQQEALQAFEDGIYAVFYGAEEVGSLSQVIDLGENKTFTFIRLTFLAGSIW